MPERRTASPTAAVPSVEGVDVDQRSFERRADGRAGGRDDDCSGRSFRREAQGAVEADVLAVEVGVADDRLDEERELLRASHPLRELRCCATSWSRIASGTLSIMGVPIVPGAMAQTRIPSGARSRASGRVMPRIAALAAAYDSWPVWPSSPAIEAVFTTTPRSPLSSGSLAPIAAAARRVTLKVPNTFIAIVWTNASLGWGVPSRATVRPPPTPPPATLTTTERVAERLCGFDRGQHAVVVVHISGDRQRPGSEFTDELAGTIGIPVEDDDRGAAFHETAHRCRTQPAGTAGDDR